MNINIRAISSKNKGKAQNSFIALKAFLVIFLLFISQLSYAQIGTWAKLNNLAPRESAGLMLVLTDGRILCQDTASGETGWEILTPDANGSYLNGTWATTASNFREHLFCNSQVLSSGKVFVAGGEYGSGDTSGEIYDPLAGTWSRTEAVYNKDNIYDGNSEMLPNGSILVGPQAATGDNNSADCLYYSPSTNKWTSAPTAPLNHDEAEWLKLPDSSILFIGLQTQKSCRFRPQTNTWISDGNVPVSISDTFGAECGPGVLLPNGKAIFFGGYIYNAIYTPTGTAVAGTWIAAANFPTIGGGKVGITDGPGAMMVNGHILLSVSPVGTSENKEFLNPAYFLEYDYTTNAFTQVTSIIPGFNSDEIASNTCSNMTFLDLPDGTVLVDESQNSSGTLNCQYYIYTPGSAAIAAGKPTINNILPDGCPYYKITGKLFNGISEGSEYGDDLQMASDYPLVRLTNAAGNVYYCKTTLWNRIGAVMTDSLEDTTVFETPSTLPAGTYSLVVVANGFASNPTLFTTLQASLGSQQNVQCYGGTGTATASVTGGLSPYTYLWSKIGGSGNIGTGLTAGTYTVTITDKNGCTATTKVTITAPTSAIVITRDSVGSPSSRCQGTAGVSVSGGTAPYTYSWSPGGATTAGITGQCPGNYCCTITDNIGCSKTVCVTVINTTTTGIAGISNSSAISIYPSPSTGLFAVAGVSQGQIIEVYSVLGKQLNSVKAGNLTMYFDLSNQADGIYMIRIVNTDGSVVTEKKVVKTQ